MEPGEAPAGALPLALAGSLAPRRGLGGAHVRDPARVRRRRRAPRREPPARRTSATSWRRRPASSRSASRRPRHRHEAPARSRSTRRSSRTTPRSPRRPRRPSDRSPDESTRPSRPRPRGSTQLRRPRGRDARDPVHRRARRTPLFVQYARDHDELDATISRLWLFLGVGVGGGALLATLAGLWVARRAMRPIAGLTATAREIATTRDPSRHMPQPVADDEVAELARTLDSMLGGARRRPRRSRSRWCTPSASSSPTPRMSSAPR